MSNEPIDLGIEGITVVERVGSGGNAVVYRARQPDLDRDVVVKVLMAVDAEATRRRFDRERRAMGRLSQAAGIAPVYESGFTSGGQPYLIMPFYERGSLQDWLEDRGAFPAEEVRSLGVSICRAVQTAHDYGVVHRDLKPANILISRLGRPDVADFGIAHLLDDTAGASTALTMTPLYTAPEVFDGIDSGVATDIYSLGALLYALLNGRPAHTDAAGTPPLLTLIRRVNEDPLPPLPASAPPALAAIVARAMDKDPAQRFPSAGAMAAALEAAELREVPPAVVDSGSPPTTVAPGPPADTAASSGGQTRMFLAALLVLAAAIGIAVLVANLTGRDDPVVTGPEDPTATSEPDPTAEPTTEPTPVPPTPVSFDTAAALAAVEQGRVLVEGFSCTGAFASPGLLLGDDLVVTGGSILRSPWLVRVTDDARSYEAEVVTGDLGLGLTIVRVNDASDIVAPPIGVPEPGDRVGVVDVNEELVEAVVESGPGVPQLVLEPARADDADAIDDLDLVVSEAGEVLGIAAGGGEALLPVETLARGFGRTPPRFGCPTLVRELGGDDIDRAVSPEIAELLRLQRLSNAYASEEWELVRELEPGKEPLTDQQFVEGWRPLRQGFIYPVERTEISDDVARWRIGLIGHETWFGSDLTTLFCVSWEVDNAADTIVQTNEDTVAVYGSQPTQPRRDGFVDPGDLRVLIMQNCPLDA